MTTRMHWSPAHVNMYDRRAAYELQERANALYLEAGGEPGTEFMKTIHATGDGWIEMSADFLEALLDRLEAGVGS